MTSSNLPLTFTSSADPASSRSVTRATISKLSPVRENRPAIMVSAPVSQPSFNEVARLTIVVTGQPFFARKDVDGWLGLKPLDDQLRDALPNPVQGPVAR